MFKQITVKGNRYEQGYQLGIFFKDKLNEKIDSFKKLLENADISNKVDELIIRLEKEFPDALEELYGKADGAWVDRKALILMHSSEIYRKPFGCTTAIYKLKDRVLFSHNEDEDGYDESDCAIVRYEYDDHFLVSFTLYDQLTGSCFGYNSYGLVYSCNYLFHEEHNLNNISRYILSRQLIENKSIEECLNFLNNNKPAQPFSFNVLDTHTNEVINIEIDYDSLNITHIEDKYSRSNHFLTKDNPKMSKNSMYRNLYAHEGMDKLNSDASLNEVYNVLCYENEEYEKSILMDPSKYKDINNSITITNFSYDSKTNEVIITDYMDKTKIKFEKE